jgi:hypothetical protein
MNIWHDLIRVAIQAPSPHNVQPWRIKVVDDANAELYIDSRRTLPKEDVTGSFIISTMGMFIEALDILAAPCGCRIEYELFHESEWYAPAILRIGTSELIPFAKLRLVQDQTADPIYDEAIFSKRRTSRIDLHEKSIPGPVIEGLVDLASEWGQRFDITTDPKQIERLLKLNTEALFEDLNSADYHDEIVDWFRYTEKQSKKHRDGLDARCMNTSPINYWLVANVPSLLLMPAVKPIMARVYRSQIGTVPTIGVISGGFWNPVEGIDAGRFLMRFWLETARNDLYIHPFGNLVTNRKAATAMERELGISNIWLIFKIGYSDEPPKSYRRAIHEFLV